MDHHEAAKSHAVERYLLGELQGAEREAFEEHFFDCQECAEQARLGAMFQANARAVLRQEPELFSPVPARRLPWNFGYAASLAACAALAMVVGYQNLVQIPRIQRSTAEGPALSVVVGAQASGVRADTKQSFSRRSGHVSLFVAHEWEEVYDRYSCELERRPGNSVLFTAKVEDGTRDFTVLLRTEALDPGDFMLNVYGVRTDGQKTAVASLPLTLTE
jgi:hypothetical protein